MSRYAHPDVLDNGPATDTDDFTWKTGVYDLEMVSAAGAVTAILTGKVSVTREVTT